MFFPFLGFGILLILRAASTQSAPNRIYPVGEDEESLIDEVAAALSAGGRGGGNPEDLFDVDLETLDYLTRGNNPTNYGDPIHDTKVKLPRKFGYTPREVQFHLSKEELQDRSQLDGVDPRVAPIQTFDEVHPDNLGMDAPAAPPHMKKNSPGIRDEEFDSGGSEPAPIQSHVMTSSHAVDHSNPAYAERIQDQSFSTLYIILVAGGSAMGVVLLVGAGICMYRINERVKATADVDYPAYGVTGPSKDVSPTGGDRKLAQSAHMYHYQHQKQQMAALQKSPLAGEQGSAGSDVESDDENEEGDYTVYECPGLAPACESMEVKNPLYQDEPTPATPQTVKCEDEGSEK